MIQTKITEYTENLVEKYTKEINLIGMLMLLEELGKEKNVPEKLAKILESVYQRGEDSGFKIGYESINN